MERGVLIDISTIPLEEQKKLSELYEIIEEESNDEGKGSLSHDTSSIQSSSSDDDNDDDFLFKALQHLKMYNGKRISPLTPLRIKRLNEIGFVWDFYEASWELRYQELVEFHKLFNSFRVPLRYNKSLCQWVKCIRAEWRNERKKSISSSSSLTKRRKMSLTRNRIDKLNAIGFEWEAKRYTWDDYYQWLLDYKEMYGTIDVPRSYDSSEHPKLGFWVSKQRQYMKKYLYGPLGERKQMIARSLGKLSQLMNPHRLQLLESIGFEVEDEW
jgi:hypothetical protein